MQKFRIEINYSFDGNQSRLSRTPAEVLRTQSVGVSKPMATWLLQGRNTVTGHSANNMNVYYIKTVCNNSTLDYQGGGAGRYVTTV